jgi:L-ribulose-5-phosphate 4-epimerase
VLETLKEQVCAANQGLVEHGLVTLTFGNVSGICPDRVHVAIKPSGVPYADLTPAQIVIVDLDGNVVEGELRPSSDTPTHLHLYRHFESIGGITHTHCRYGTAFAQARSEIPCLGTTHADHFCGPVPVTRVLRPEEVETAYELNTGWIIVERFVSLDPMAIPAVLVAGHAPFVWGRSVNESLENAIALEAVAAMAIATMGIDLDAESLEDYLLEKHFQRKHGSGAYYGQD